MELFNGELYVVSISVVTALITSIIVSFLANVFYFKFHKNEHIYNLKQRGLPTVVVYQGLDYELLLKECDFKNNTKSRILKQLIIEDEDKLKIIYRLRPLNLVDNKIDENEFNNNKYQALIINNKTDRLFEMTRIIIGKNNDSPIIYEFSDSDISILKDKCSFIILVPSFFPLVPRIEIQFEDYLMIYHNNKQKEINLIVPDVKKSKI